MTKRVHKPLCVAPLPRGVDWDNDDAVDAAMLPLVSAIDAIPRQKLHDYEFVLRKRAAPSPPPSELDRLATVVGNHLRRDYDRILGQISDMEAALLHAEEAQRAFSALSIAFEAIGQALQWRERTVMAMSEDVALADWLRGGPR